MVSWISLKSILYFLVSLLKHETDLVWAQAGKGKDHSDPNLQHEVVQIFLLFLHSNSMFILIAITMSVFLR